MADHVTVLTTVDSPEAAEALARGVIEARLAACAQIVPGVRSLYWWDGAVQDDPELLILFKTTADRYPELEVHLQSNHAYDEPEIVRLPIEAGSAGYLEWVTQQTRPAQS